MIINNCEGNHVIGEKQKSKKEQQKWISKEEIGIVVGALILSLCQHFIAINITCGPRYYYVINFSFCNYQMKIV